MRARHHQRHDLAHVPPAGPAHAPFVISRSAVRVRQAAPKRAFGRNRCHPGVTGATPAGMEQTTPTVRAAITARDLQSLAGRPGGVDADVFVDDELAGACTLLPREGDPTGVLDTWGPSRDYWADTGLLHALDQGLGIGQVLDAVRAAVGGAR